MENSIDLALSAREGILLNTVKNDRETEIGQS